MKNRLTHILLTLLAALVITSCGNTSNEDFDKLSNNEKLKVLDIQIHKHPNDAELYYKRADVLLAMDENKEAHITQAINDLMKAIQIDDTKCEYYMLLGDAYFANRDIEHSYSSLERALELDKDNIKATLKLGEIAFYGRDYDRAMDHLSKVTAKDPNNRTALFMKGFIYKETGDTNNAIVLMRKVCDLHPDYAQAFETLGSLYADMDNPMAVEYLNTAIKLDSANTNAMYCLAMYFQDKDRLDEAENLYKQILDMNANNADAWHNRGYIALMREDYDQAIDHFSKAIMIDNRYTEAHINRGYAYELKGDRQNAEICYRTALEIDPTCQLAQAGLTRLGKK